jgi:GAF domain-containing protein
MAISISRITPQQSAGTGSPGLPAIPDAESPARLTRLAEEQAALRRVATLVAGGTPPQEVFAAVTEEVGRLLGSDLSGMARFDTDTTLTVLAAWASEGEQHPLVPGPWPIEGDDIASRVWRTGRSSRIDDYHSLPGRIAEFVREQLGIRSSIASPIVVEGRLWGTLFIHSKQTREPFPAVTEARLASFTELVAAAVANAETRARLARLVDEQAALRRVATLVARGMRQEELFALVPAEVGRLLPAEYAHLGRYEPDGGLVIVGTWDESAGTHLPVGSRWAVGGKNLATSVLETGRSTRMDDYADASGPLGIGARERGVRSAVGTPIIVEGRAWGVAIAGVCGEQGLPGDAEARLGSFTDLVATAIANAESGAGLARLADEQAALRRVATLVAAAVPQGEVFAAVIKEIGGLFGVDYGYMGRYEPDSTLAVVATWGRADERFPVGTRVPIGGGNLGTIVFETGRSGRIDDYSESASGALGRFVRGENVRCAVATPIMVEGRIWGLISVGAIQTPSLPADTEDRLGSFTELVATAVANAESRAALAASRSRIVAAADESRRRIQRDLHDGAQQRLVHAVIVLKLALQALSDGYANAGELVTEALSHAEQAHFELRELAHGILPAALTRGGLRAGIDSLVSRVSLPVSVDVSVPRLPAGVEATAYFVISEALTNVVKHAKADRAEVLARVERGELRVEVRDNGVGAAHAGNGTGLGGLADRISALDGRFVLDSPPAGGTCVCAFLPVSD